jgi:hypothetical protein
VPPEERPRPALPPQGLRVAGIPALPAMHGQNIPQPVQFPVLPEQVIPA